MRLIDKSKLTTFEASRIESTSDGFIIVMLGPYSNYRTLNKDYRKIVNQWRNSNNKEELPITNNMCYILRTVVTWFRELFYNFTHHIT